MSAPADRDYGVPIAGTVDWLEDTRYPNPPGIDQRIKMEHGKFYADLDTNYCSQCGVTSAHRDDLVSVLRRTTGNPKGSGYSYCPDHLTAWIEGGANFERWNSPMTAEEKLQRIAAYAPDAPLLSPQMVALILASAR